MVMSSGNLDPLKLTELGNRLIAKLEEANQAYYTFKARPDDPANFDEQESFINSRLPGVAIHQGGNGCLHPDEPLTDCVTGETRAIKDWDRPFRIETFNHETGEIEIGWANKPYLKGQDEIFEVRLSNGESIRCTGGHEFLCPDGEFREVSQLCVGDALLSPLDYCRSGVSSHVRTFGDYALSWTDVSGEGSLFEIESDPLQSTIGRLLAEFSPTTSQDGDDVLRRQQNCRECGHQTSVKCDPSYWQTTGGYQGDYLPCHHLDDGQLPLSSDTCQSFSPLPSDGDGCSHWSCSSDGLAGEREHTHLCRYGDHRSSFRCDCQLPQSCEVEPQFASCICSQPSEKADIQVQHSDTTSGAIDHCKAGLQPLELSFRHRHTSNTSQPQAICSVSQLIPCDSVRVESIVSLHAQLDYYDLTVFPHHNYVHKGIVSKNSGTTTAAIRKAVLFMLNQQPPPRKDTPFWIVTPNYEIGIKTLWKEKLYGRGHLPASEVDWNRISWFEKKTELPISVPLKPWPRERGGHPQKNWVIEFKSWLSGRDAMSGASVGGFCVSEQLPWEILMEIVARCRDYDFPGSQFYEFTPVDPALTAELESIIAQDKLPRGWGIFRSSTVKNAQAGHVSSAWLESFRDAVSDEMLETRLTGAFPAFDGVIYPNFHPKTHTVNTRVMSELLREAQKTGLIHRRAIDWGMSKEHPFFTIFACRDTYGRWYVYDEVFNDGQLLHNDMISLVMNKREWPERNPAYGVTYADPSRPDLMHAFGQHMSIAAANNRVYEGIESVRVALKVGIDGKPNLIIDAERCPNLVRQLRGYRWRKSPQTGLNPASAKPEPLKREDDGPDALRYLLHSERRTGGPIASAVVSKRDVPSHFLAKHNWVGT